MSLSLFALFFNNLVYVIHFFLFFFENFSLFFLIKTNFNFVILIVGNKFEVKFIRINLIFINS